MKNSKRRVVGAGENDLDDQKHRKRQSSVFLKKNHGRPKEIVTKNKSGYPDLTNNYLAHPEETLDNEALQATTRPDHNGGGQATAQTQLTCAVSQAERM